MDGDLRKRFEDQVDGLIKKESNLRKDLKLEGDPEKCIKMSIEIEKLAFAATMIGFTLEHENKK